MRPIATLLAIVLLSTLMAALGRAQSEPVAPVAATAAAEYVHTALQFELDGDYSYRERMLALALKTDPDCTEAQWQLGQVLVNGQWTRANDVDHLKADALRRSYRQMRDEALGDPERELKLARWCHRKRLDDVAQLHYTRLLRHTSDAGVRREAIKRLNLRYWDGQLVTQETWERNHAESKAAITALEKWRPKFERWRKRSQTGNTRFAKSKSQEPLGSLVTLETIPVVESFISDSGPKFGAELVRELNRLQYFEATQTLMRFALLSPWPTVQEAAVDALQERSLHEFVPALIAALESPIKTRYSVTSDRAGNVRYQHLYLREGAAANHVVGTEHISRPVGMRTDVRRVGIGEGLATGVPLAPQVAVGETIRTEVDRGSIEMAMRTLAAEAETREAQVQAENAKTNARNAYVFHVLEQATGTLLNRDPEDWRRWWQQYNESGANKQTYVEYRPEQSHYMAQYQRTFVRSSSCFAAGTPVWTDGGLRPIEELVPGDRVLSQDPNTGELKFVPIWQRTEAAPASALTRLTIDDDEVSITRAHVVWRIGEGWKMVKELEPGDRLAGREPGLTVAAMTAEPTPELVYNLVVPDTHTYFVGRAGVLVHDITYRQPTNAVLPGLLR